MTTLVGLQDIGLAAEEDLELDVESLREQTVQNCRMMTTASFLTAWQSVVAAPNEARCQKGQEHLNVDTLRASGIDIPSGMRISSRYFEKSFEDRDEATYDDLASRTPGLVPPAPVTAFKDDLAGSRERGQLAVEVPALWACAGGGAFTVCGCAGGGKVEIEGTS